MKFNTEKQFVDNLQNRLEKIGYKTWREVIPDECIGWSQPFRIDLVIWHPEHRYIGIEAKNIRSLRQGAIFAQAIRQVETYRTFQYSGRKINKWCVVAPIDIETIYAGSDKETILKEITYFIQNFIKNKYDISMLNDLVIDAGTKNKIDLNLKCDKQDYPFKLNEYKLLDDNKNEKEFLDNTFWWCSRCNWRNIDCWDSCDACHTGRYICQSCDSELDVEDKFCPNCGLIVKGDDYENN
jgi:hypothetical protein